MQVEPLRQLGRCALRDGPPPSMMTIVCASRTTSSTEWLTYTIEQSSPSRKRSMYGRIS